MRGATQKGEAAVSGRTLVKLKFSVPFVWADIKNVIARTTEWKTEERRKEILGS